MAYIPKNNSALLSTRFTDVGRRKLSQGKLNITYFQVGDSEIAYGVIPNYNHTENIILQAEYNAQNSTFEPETNKMNVKYPFYLTTSSGSTYGIAVQDSKIIPIFAKAAPLGFFQGSNGSWSANTSIHYTLNANYVIDLCQCNGNNIILQSPNCDSFEFIAQSPLGGEVTYTDCLGQSQTITVDNVTPTQACVSTVDNLVNATSNYIGNCGQTPLCDDCANLEPQVGDIAVIYYGNCTCGELTGPLPILFYNVIAINGNIVTLDRPIPNYLDPGCCGCARVFFYPGVSNYDTNTTDCVTDTCGCDDPNSIVRIWNMNIPWSTSPAGVISSLNEDYTKYASAPYLGSKEYFGYQEISGQTFWTSSTSTGETTDTYYYDSLDKIVPVEPYEQKAIAIVHYTNNSVCNYYGEKFALNPYDPSSTNTTGLARNFKVSIPWLMWHKSLTCVMGETFYVDPMVGSGDYFQVHYMRSTPNPDMNDPGLRYYLLWDTHLNSDGNPNRVGKVFPDLKTIVFDDEEIVAALSYKSNRNWTLPAPYLSTSVPNLSDSNPDDLGALSGSDQYMYVTYRLDDSATFTSSLHCNYYRKIQGKNGEALDVNVSFGDEFCFLASCDCCFAPGFSAREFYILAQIVSGSTTQPSPDAWRIMDFTLDATTTVANCQTATTECITAQSLTSKVFTIRHDQYYNAPIYNLDNFIDIPSASGQENYLQFGDEYFFYGVVETDIASTLYEMNYLVNLQSSQFTKSSNPLWRPGMRNYISEIGLFDDDKDLIIITKLQSPILRQGVQQFAIKMDF